MVVFLINVYETKFVNRQPIGITGFHPTITLLHPLRDFQSTAPPTAARL